MQTHKEIDTRGLNCPLPILKAKKALADMQSGDILKVVATDPGSVRVGAEPDAAHQGDAVGPAPDLKAVQVHVFPSEGDLQDVVKVGDAGVAVHE